MPPTDATHQQQLEALETVVHLAAEIVQPMFDEIGADFIVVGFTRGESGWITYSSNVKRDEMLQELRRLADQLDANLEMPTAVSGRDPEAG